MRSGNKVHGRGHVNSHWATGGRDYEVSTAKAQGFGFYMVKTYNSKLII